MKRPYQILVDRSARREFDDSAPRHAVRTGGPVLRSSFPPVRRADACGAHDEEHMIGTLKRAALTALLVAVGMGGLHAQSTTGGLTGVIKDADGGVVPGATVKATATATGTVLTAVSDDTGQYVVRGLPVGPYNVQVELSGFQTVQVEGVVVRVNEEVR